MSFKHNVSVNNAKLTNLFIAVKAVASDDNSSPNWAAYNSYRASYNRSLNTISAEAKKVKTTTSVSEYLDNRERALTVEKTWNDTIKKNYDADISKMKKLKPTTAEYKALKKKTDKYKTAKSKSDKRVKKIKSSVSKAKSKITSIKKEVKIKKAKKLAKKLVKEAGSSDYIMPVNPGTKSSLVKISIESDTGSGTGNFTEYPVEKGTPISDFGMAGQWQDTVTARIYGKKKSNGDYNIKSAITAFKKLRKWSNSGIGMRYKGFISLNGVWITELDYDKSDSESAFVHATITLSKYRSAVSKSSGVKGKKKASKKGGKKANKKGTEYVTVKSGDTLWKYMRKTGTSISQLKKWNGGTGLIKVGQKLRVK